MQLVDDSCWKIPVYSHLHNPGRTSSSKKGDPRCASKNCQVKHLLSLIPQDTVGVKGIAQISPEQFAWHWGSLGMMWWGCVGVGSGWHAGNTQMKGCKEALENVVSYASGGGYEVVFPCSREGGCWRSGAAPARDTEGMAAAWPWRGRAAAPHSGWQVMGSPKSTCVAPR